MQEIRGEHLPWTPEFQAAGPISEDCLYLNVWVPAHATHAHLPVLVWIHGGAFNVGSAAPVAYHGEELAKKGVIVVTINYRLDVFGFMSHPELTAESPHHASGDYGLQDAVAALQWVQQNIAAFGGDPKRVTIAGQSAGAGAVLYLTASPLAKELFRGAIAESGAWANQPPMKTLEEEQAKGMAFANFAGVHSLQELRAMPAASILTTHTQSNIRFDPDVDGWFMPEEPSAIFAAEQQNDVTTITGMNADEKSAAPTYGRIKTDAFKKQVHAQYGDMADDLLHLYPVNSDAEAKTQQIEVARDSGKVAMYLWVAQRAKTAKTPAYTYYFDHPIPWPEHREFGAFHSSDIPYWMATYKVLDRPYTPVDDQLVHVMSSYWVDFITAGTPNRKGLPEWSAVRVGSVATMEIGDKIGSQPLASPEKLAFWLRYYGSHLSDQE
jgi:para-nitrobenzyl esterase